MKKSTIVLIVLLVLAVALVGLIATSPTSSGGSSSSYKVGPLGEIRTMSLVTVSQTKWNRKGKVRNVDGHAHRVRKNRSSSRAVMSGARSGPCYRVEAEVHGDSKLIDKVVQGLLHAKLCMKAGDHTQVLDKYTGASMSHRETWMWDFQSVDETKGAGVSTHWCNGGVGPCMPVEYRYWRYTFHWLQGVNVFGQTLGLHHKTLYVGCTLRAGPGGFQCGTGEA